MGRENKAKLLLLRLKSALIPDIRQKHPETSTPAHLAWAPHLIKRSEEAPEGPIQVLFQFGLSHSLQG